MKGQDTTSRKLDLLSQAYKKVQERDELEKIGFSIIKDGDGIDCGQWVHELITNFPKEVMAVFDGDPTDIAMLLTDTWESHDYEDGDSGLSMSWGEWSSFFSNEVSFRVYDRLVEERKEFQRMETELAKSKAEAKEARERLKQIQILVQNE